MNISETVAPKARTAFLLAAVLATSTFALAPAPAYAWSGSESSYAQEGEAERACADWQKVHRCAGTAGELRYQCVAKGPFSKFWAMLRGDDAPQDDEVRVKVIRKAPAPNAFQTTPAPEASPAASTAPVSLDRQVSNSQTRHSTRIVKKGETPPCRDNG